MSVISLETEFDAAEALAVGPRVRVPDADKPKRKSKKQLADEFAQQQQRNLAAAGDSATVIQDVAIAPSSRVSGPIGGLIRTDAGQCLYLDIETVPDYSREHLFGLPPVPVPLAESTADECGEPGDFLNNSVANFAQELRDYQPCDDFLSLLIVAERAAKNRDGIVKEIESFRRERQKVIDAAAERRKLLSTTPEYLRIVAVGWAVGGGEVRSMLNVETEDGLRQEREVEILSTILSLVESDQAPIVGYGILGFDLPAILTRCVLLGVPVGRLIDRRPWGRDVIDVCSARYDKAWGKPLGLKPLAKCLGIQVPEEGMDGSQVEEMMAADPAKVARYVESDVVITREVHWMYRGVFCP